MDSSQSYTDFSKICMITLALYPVLSYYIAINEFTYADVLSVLLLLIGIFKYGMFSTLHYRFPTVFNVYWAYIAILSIATASAFKITYLIPGGITFFVWISQVALFACFFDFDKYKKYLNYLFYVVTVLFFIQYGLKLAGSFVPMFLPLGDKTSYCGLSVSEVLLRQTGGTARCSTIFPEPAYMGQFLALVLAVNAFCKENLNKFYDHVVAIVLVNIFLLGSGSGLLIGLVLMLVKAVYLIFASGQKKYIFLLFLIAPILYYTINYYFLSQIGSYVLSRTSELSSDSSSGYLRMVSGYLYVGELDTSHFLFGADKSYIEKLFNTGDKTFVNGIASYILFDGLIGTILVLLTFITTAWRKDFIVWSVVIMFIVLSAIEATYMREFSMAVFALIIGYSNRRLNNGETI